MQSNIVHNFLKRRGITDDVITQFGIHEGEQSYLGSCIVIPIMDSNGDFSFNKYRRHPLNETKPKYIYDKGSKTQLFGAHLIKDKDKVLITEGEMDALVAWSSHIPAVSSTGGAMSFKEEWAELLKGKEVYVCFDNDEAGGKGLVRVLNIIPDVRIIFLPDAPHIKDISDYVAHGGDLHALMKTPKVFGSEASILEDRSERLALFKSVHFHEAWIDEQAQKNKTAVRSLRKQLNDSKIEKAKQYPIPELLKLDRQNKHLCIWHKENTPSLTYFPDNNKVYCFGCNKSADAIDVYRHLHNKSFKEALEDLT